MALDIAPALPSASPPGSVPSAVGTAPEAGAASPFAALLAIRVQGKAAGPPLLADMTDPLPGSQKTEKDDKESKDQDDIGAQTIPPTLLINPNIVPLPVPIGGAILSPVNKTDSKPTDPKPIEVMDTVTAQPNGELLPRMTAQFEASLPSAQAAKDAGTKNDPVNLSENGKNVLQISAKPANNTGKAVKTQTPSLMEIAPVTSEKTTVSSSEDLLAKLGDALQKGTSNQGSKPEAQAPVPVPPVAEAKVVSAPAPVAPLTSNDRNALIQQASEAVQTMRVHAAVSGQGQMTLQLHPHDWGKLEVSVSMTPSGASDGGTNVTAHLIAESHAVRTALEDHASELRTALHDAGMTLERITVTVRSVEAGSESQQANTDTRSEQQNSANTGTQTNFSFGAGGGSAAFGFANNSGFYTSPGAQWTGLEQEVDQEPVGAASLKSITQGIDIRA